MTYELTEEQRNELVAKEIESAKIQIFENRINIAKWTAMEGDWSNQIAAAEQAIADLQAGIDALADLS